MNKTKLKKEVRVLLAILVFVVGLTAAVSMTMLIAAVPDNAGAITLWGRLSIAAAFLGITVVAVARLSTWINVDESEVST